LLVKPPDNRQLNEELLIIVNSMKLTERKKIANIGSNRKGDEILLTPKERIKIVAKAIEPK